VSLAALAATQAALSAASHALESHLDKLMPLLFLKLCASKLQTRVAAEGALKGKDHAALKSSSKSPSHHNEAQQLPLLLCHASVELYSNSAEHRHNSAGYFDNN
jgi:hypothetical protein